MPKKTVGSFSCDEAGNIEGPAEYMKEQGAKMIDKIQSGKSAVVNFGLRQPGADLITVVLVALQTDFSGWLGMRQMVNSLSRKG